MNRLLPFILLIALSLLFMGSLAPELSTAGHSIFQAAGCFFLYYNGTLKNSTYKKWILIAITVLLLGTVFKIMHWPFSASLILSGSIGATVFYSLHFFAKKSKHFFDYGKLLFVYAYLCLSLLTVFHLYNALAATVALKLLFVLFVLAYIYKYHRSDLTFR